MDCSIETNQKNWWLQYKFASRSYSHWTMEGSQLARWIVNKFLVISKSILTYSFIMIIYIYFRKNYPVCGYDQYGSMSGSIVIDHSDSPNELYLSGIRERRWGLNYAKFMRRSFNITGKTTDGTFYNIIIQSHKKRMSQ